MRRQTGATAAPVCLLTPPAFRHTSQAHIFNTRVHCAATRTLQPLASASICALGFLPCDLEQFSPGFAAGPVLLSDYVDSLRGSGVQVVCAVGRDVWTECTLTKSALDLEFALSRWDEGAAEVLQRLFCLASDALT